LLPGINLFEARGGQKFRYLGMLYRGSKVKEKKDEIVLGKTKAETTLDIASLVSSVVPWIGSPVSNVLSGVSFGRKISRVREALENLARDLRDFKSQVSEEYVKTEEFEELLEKTLRMIADERNDDKRRIFRAFLTDAIKSPGEPYDEQMRILKTLEQLQIEHMRIIKALNEQPQAQEADMIFGAPITTLTRRLPDMPSDRIEELLYRLNDLHLTNLTSLRTTMTGRGAADLRHSITPFGRKFVDFILEEKQVS